MPVLRRSRKNRVRARVRVCVRALAAALQGSFDLREIYEEDGDRKEPQEREGGDDGDDAAAFRTWNNERAAGEDLPGPSPLPIHSSTMGKHDSLSHLHWDQVQQAAREPARLPAPFYCGAGRGGVRAGGCGRG